MKHILVRIALNISGCYCFFLINDILWYPNFLIPIVLVILGLLCFIKGNFGGGSGRSVGSDSGGCSSCGGGCSSCGGGCGGGE